MKGIGLQIDDDLDEQIDNAVKAKNENSPIHKLTKKEWILTAIINQLKKDGK